MQTRGVGVRDVVWDSVCIGMCVCERERERERGCLCVCVRERVCVYIQVCDE